MSIEIKIICFVLLFQRSDIAMAIAKNDMFDFLIDIVPREEIQSKSSKPGASTKVRNSLQILVYVPVLKNVVYWIL